MPKSYLQRAMQTPLRVVASLCCVFLVIATVVTVPAGAIETDDLVAVFQRGDRVYIDSDAESVDEAQLDAAVTRAGELGYELYIAVLGPSSPEVDNSQVRKALGEVTVATWSSDTYRINSDDICNEALNRADQQAKANTSIRYPPDDFMTAFVASLETSRDSCASKGLPGWLRFLLIGVAIAAAALLLAWLFAQGQDRAAETRRADEFRERRTILRDWGNTLSEPLEELREPVKASGNAEYQEMFDDAAKVAENAESDIDGAKALPDLDRAEIRIARAQMRIRDLYEALPDVSRD